jgi:hypothetical protein
MTGIKELTWLADMKTWVSSSLYLKSTRQMEKPALSNLIISTIIFASIKTDSLLVEPLERTASSSCLQVGVLPLPLLKVERRLREVVERVLGLGLLGHERLIVIVILDNLLLLGRLLGLGSLLSLGLVLLGLLGLGGGSVGGGLGERRLAVVKDGSKLGLVDEAACQRELSVERTCDSRLEVSHNVGDLGAHGRVNQAGEHVSKSSGDKDIGDGNPLSDQPGLVVEVVVELGQARVDAVKDTSDNLLDQRLPR